MSRCVIVKADDGDILRTTYTRLDHEDARAQGRIPTIPVPDVRFEQSYLMSIQREHMLSMLTLLHQRPV